MVPNKLVYSGNFFLKHERVYTRLLGRLSVALRLTFLKFSLVIGIPVVILNDLGFKEYWLPDCYDLKLRIA